jgi:carotenoid cleavage dioxygenase-like enzyme
LHGDLGSCVEVGRITVGNDGVEAVVAAAELNDDENAVIRNSWIRTEQRIAEDAKGAALDEAGHGRRE